MSTPASSLQIEANRANALFSTGPRTDQGKHASSRNAQPHGLTTRDALLPGEDAGEYQRHRQNYLDRHQPQDPIDQAVAVELADLEWRLRRVPVFEARLLSIEVTRLSTDPELRPLVERLRSDAEIVALGFSRLIESKVLPNLYCLEARLSRRAEKLQRRLENSLPPSVSIPLPLPERVKEDKIANQQNEANSDCKPVVPQAPARVLKVGRNELCPCRSGLKFKRCCLNQPRRLSPDLQRTATSRERENDRVMANTPC
jgi:hypothetical protein